MKECGEKRGETFINKKQNSALEMNLFFAI